MGSDNHIFFVEDNAATREYLALLLGGAGYGLAGAGNGRQAEPHLVILLDLRLPVMGGWQFRLEQRHDPALALIPVVLVAGESDLPRMAASLPVASCIPKPVELAKLLQALRVIARRRQRRGQEGAGPPPELGHPGQVAFPSNREWDGRTGTGAGRWTTHAPR
jgi:CheY-like chemotaxis protein